MLVGLINGLTTQWIAFSQRNNVAKVLDRLIKGIKEKIIHFVGISGYLSVEKYFSQSDTATLNQITIFVRELYGYWTPEMYCIISTVHYCHFESLPSSQIPSQFGSPK